MDIKFINQEIEKYRLKNKLTMEELTKGIVSVRTYRRHIYNETELSYETYSQLLKRLKLNVEPTLVRLSRDYLILNMEYNQMMQQILYQEYDKANEIYEKIKPLNFDDNDSKFLLKVTINDLLAYNKVITQKQAIENQKKIIDINHLKRQSFITESQAIVLDQYDHIFTGSDKEVLKEILHKVAIKEIPIRPLVISFYTAIVVKDFKLRFEDQIDYDQMFIESQEIIDRFKKDAYFRGIHDLVAAIKTFESYKNHQELATLVDQYSIYTYLVFSPNREKINLIADKKSVENLLIEIEGELNE